MDPISNADRLVRLLRQKLEERKRLEGAKSPAAVSAVQPRASGAAASIAGSLARAGVDAPALRRAIVEQLLADQLGAGMVNDAKFQQLVDEVTRIMEADATIAQLFDEAIDGLGR